MEGSYFNRRIQTSNPSTISSKSLTQSRYLPGSSAYNFENSSGRQRSRWENGLSSKNDNYDFDKFSKYINDTFQTSGKAKVDNVEFRGLKPKEPIYQSPYKTPYTSSYQVSPNLKSFAKKVPTMTESRFLRSSSANNLYQVPINSDLPPSNYYQLNQYNLAKEPTPTRTSTYRVVKGTPTSELPNGVYQGYSAQRNPDYTSSTGGGLTHFVSAKLHKGTTRYTGGTRQGLVQSMYKEKPSNLLQMKYGNLNGTGMRF